MLNDPNADYFNQANLTPWVKPFRKLPDQQLKAAFMNEHLDHCSELSYKSEPFEQKLTGVICTIGKACRNINTLVKMFEAGMNIARLNLSRGSHEDHVETIDLLRQAVNTYSHRLGYQYPLGIAMDTRGPELRLGCMKGGKEIDLKSGDTFVVSTNPALADCGNADFIYISDPNLSNAVSPGDKMYIDGGNIIVTVEDVKGYEIFTRVDAGGKLKGGQNVSVPGVPVHMPAITEQDKQDLAFGAHANVDFVFASYVRDPETIRQIRDIMGSRGRSCMVIPKIECAMSVDNIDELIAAGDGIMIARGDLSMDMDSEKCFIVQKMIFAKCNMAGKPCICASQMLDSMTEHPRPTRAEVADVANAVLDGCDCVTLSNETSKGKYPLLSVRTISNICREAESAVWQKQFFTEMWNLAKPPVPPSHAIAIAASNAALKCCASAIIVISTSGRTARLIARYRPRCPVVTVTRHSKVIRQNTIFRGIISCHYAASLGDDWLQDMDKRIKFAVSQGKKNNFIHHGDALILVTGWHQGSGYTNTLRIVYASASGTDQI